ncbi:MAG: glucan biosynthesis protein G [Candidatus Competibacteraceae bacterium]
MENGSVMFYRVLLMTVIMLGLASPVSAVPNLPPADTSDTAPPKRFNFADVHRRAANLAQQPYREPDHPIPAFLRELSYDHYRDIRFRADKGLWRDDGLPFEVQFAHPGFLFLQPVKINVVEEGEVKPIPFREEWFDYGTNTFPEPLPPDLGFAGFRLHYPLHRDSYYDEVAVFLGASYFRAVGQQQTYGLSARGLAIDTGLPKAEEFPSFREFWLEKPQPDATEITLYALLDSPSVTGAYRFVVKPGPATVIDVKAQLFLREAVEKFAVAPLTSMFFHGEPTERFMDDFRPEVHDSDGLLLALGSGEWLWRPLNNPTRLQTSAFRDNNPRGFGLLQRDRDFNDYQDLEAHYQQRPSVWVEPLGEWGPGFVELVEIPADAERYDNIVAFWVPEQPLDSNSTFTTEYRLYFALQLDRKPPGGKTLATRIGAGGVIGSDPSRRLFVLDFGGPVLADLPEQTPIKALVSASAGKIENVVVTKNPHTAGWRASLSCCRKTNRLLNYAVS